MAKRDFLVLGPESSGNRLVTRLLIGAGCEGDGGHDQRFDKPDSLKSAADLIVIRRSLPYGDHWADLDFLLDRLRNNGYDDVRIVALLRTHWCTTRSQVKAGHHARVPTDQGKLDEAEWEIASAMRRIGQFALENHLPIRYITFESLRYHFEAFRRTMLEWGLDVKEPAEPIRDENQKWLG